MSEGADFDPGEWRGYSFRSARAAFDAHAGRSYDDAVSKKISLDKLVPKMLETDSPSPLVIACDVTGSMGEWPATIFEKLPLLDLEAKEYLTDNAEISFAAIGDAFVDKYPLQVQKFSKGKDLTARLKELIIEGGGGGQTSESYELAALYYANKVKMPKAVKPLFIFIGDEGLYDRISEDHTALVGVKSEKSLSTKDVMEELKSKFEVYLIRKLYDEGGRDGMTDTDRKIQKQWESYLGADHIAILPEPRRVVDVILGILAKETSMEDYFKKELTERQLPGQVATVMKALKTVHMPPLLADPGKSVLKRTGATKGKTKPLV